MRFPIVLKSEMAPRPSGRFYYEVASNGVFQVTETETYRAVTRVRGEVPGLCPSKEEVSLKFPKVPAELLGEILAFFDEVYRRYSAEAIIILFYRPSDETYLVKVPPQSITGHRDWRGNWRADLHLDYMDVKRPAGYLRFGTIHSHADLPAYASAIDCEDERFQDGLHVIFGHFNRKALSRSASFVAGGARFSVDPDRVLEACGRSGRDARRDWLAPLRIVGDDPSSRFRGRWQTSPRVASRAIYSVLCGRNSKDER